MKANAVKSKVMVINGEDELECEVHVDRVCLEHVFKFKYLDIWDVFWTNQVQMGQNVVGRWKGGGGWQVLLGPQLMLGICRLNGLEP